MTERTPTHEELSHERLGDRFEHALSNYDTERRVRTLVDGFLTDEMVRGKTALDAGCGLGFFSERLAARGAKVTACDLGPGLVEKTRERVGCDAEVADVLDLARQFGTGRFDLVVSSECIEHVPQPTDAIREMIAVLKPSGYLALSTPNILWSPIVKTATALKLRPFDGHENFSSWRAIRKAVETSGATIVREHGLHLFPFQLPLNRFSAWCDRNLQPLRGLMINICILAQKENRE